MNQKWFGSFVADTIRLRQSAGDSVTDRTARDRAQAQFADQERINRDLERLFVLNFGKHEKQK